MFLSDSAPHFRSTVPSATVVLQRRRERCVRGGLKKQKKKNKRNARRCRRPNHSRAQVHRLGRALLIAQNSRGFLTGEI